MDELAAALESSFQVSNVPNNPNAPHPRFAQYKIKQNIPDQQERRRRILEQQKKGRFDFLKHARNLAGVSWEEEEEVEDEEEKENAKESEETMEVQACAVKKPPKGFKDQLMLSEWMVDVPEALQEKWLMVPCPVGRRSLVVSSAGTTSAYTKGGYCYNRFPSLLPGGNRRYANDKGGYSILDCLYSEVDRTFYVLDVMCWNGHPVYDSETDFRFYWSSTKITEVEKLAEISRINPFRFIPLPNYPCNQEALTEALSQSTNLKLDGLLFYHREAHYTFGSTPLVVWLKPFMLPEMLGIAVPEAFLSDKPAHYTNVVNHVQEWKDTEKDKLAKIELRKQNRSKKEGMETGQSPNSHSKKNNRRHKNSKSNLSRSSKEKQETMDTSKVSDADGQVGQETSESTETENDVESQSSESMQ